MAITINFEADSDYTIGAIPSLLESLFYESILTTITDSFWSGYGFYDNVLYYADLTGINLSGTGLISPAITSIEFDFISEVIDLPVADIDITELLSVFDDTGDFAFVSYLMDQTWTMRLSDNADIAPRELSGGPNPVEFNLRGNDIIYANGGNDELFTGDGNDRVYGGTGNDRLDGGNGNDQIWGGSGTDILIGDNGNDRLVGNGGDDRIIGGRGQDRLYGSEGRDRIYGGSSADVIIGGDDRDYINGGIGNDRIYGGGGWDQLYGNAGNDLLVGGAGADDFIFRDGQGDNIIRDFDALSNAEDIILRGVTAITDFADLRDNHMVQVGADVVIDDGAGLTITLQNVDLGDLGARDFIF